MAGTFQVFTDKTGKHRFRLRATGQGTVLASESHDSREACLAAVEAVREHAARGKAYERKEAHRGQFGYILKGGERETLGIGGGFASMAEREKAIHWLMNHAAAAEVVDAEPET
jgi:uncharacterized protein YegP (UPF0339 family)